ncbi:MAG: hypothetical protein ACOCRX_10865 [Candidatus Woesearchaeota archaeon]
MIKIKELKKLINLAEKGEFLTVGEFTNYVYTEYEENKAKKLIKEFNKKWRN